MKKRGTRKGTGNSGYNLAGFDHFWNEILTELKRVKYKNLADMVYRMQLNYHQNVDKLDLKITAGSNIGYTLPLGVCKITDNNMM